MSVSSCMLSSYSDLYGLMILCFDYTTNYMNIKLIIKKNSNESKNWKSLYSNAEILVLMIRTNVGRLQRRQSIDTIL